MTRTSSSRTSSSRTLLKCTVRSLSPGPRQPRPSTKGRRRSACATPSLPSSARRTAGRVRPPSTGGTTATPRSSARRCVASTSGSSRASASGRGTRAHWVATGVLFRSKCDGVNCCGAWSRSLCAHTHTHTHTHTQTHTHPL